MSASRCIRPTIRFIGVGLLALSALASAQAPDRPSGVDDVSACNALGGLWVADARNAWLHQCLVSAPGASACESRGGQWTPGPVAPGGCLLAVSPGGTAAQCARAGGVWGPHGSRGNYCLFEADRRACLTQGGDWRRVGLAQRYACVLSAPDAGRPCRDKSDCRFGCEYFGPPTTSGALVWGQCAADNLPFGCRSWVEGGRASPRFCVD